MSFHNYALKFVKKLLPLLLLVIFVDVTMVLISTPRVETSSYLVSVRLKVARILDNWNQTSKVHSRNMTLVHFLLPSSHASHKSQWHHVKKSNHVPEAMLNFEVMPP
jgi:hypothetical protein